MWRFVRRSPPRRQGAGNEGIYLQQMRSNKSRTLDWVYNKVICICLLQSSLVSLFFLSKVEMKWHSQRELQIQTGRVITNTVYISGHFLTLRNMFIITAIRFYWSQTKAKHSAALPLGGNINVTSSMYNSHSSQFSTIMLRCEISLLDPEDAVQLCHFYSGEEIAIIDSSYYGE